VQKGPNGQGLHPQYFLKLLQFMSKTSKDRRSVEKDDALLRRRETHKVKDWDKYKEIVQAELMQDDQMMQVIMHEVISNLPETSD